MEFLGGFFKELTLTTGRLEVGKVVGGLGGIVEAGPGVIDPFIVPGLVLLNALRYRKISVEIP